MYKEERTCTCIKDFVHTDRPGGKQLEFHEKREYQVDIFPLYYQVYQNGGWNDFVFLTDEQFSTYFKLIE